MDEKSVFYRYRLYLLGVGVLTLIALLLRTLALFLAFDADLGYFATDIPARRFLVYLLYIIEILAIAACCALPFLIRKDELPRERAPLSRVATVGSGLCALLLAVCAVYVLLHVNTLPCPITLTVPAVICCGFACVYFALQCLDRQSQSPAFGYGVILAAALLLSITYFDRYTQMNAPHKVGLHLCLLSVMLFMIYEIRVLVDRPMPRALSITSAVCFFFCAVVGVSDIIAFIGGVYTDFLYFIMDLLVTGFALYVGSRAVRDLMQTAPDAATGAASDKDTK